MIIWITGLSGSGKTTLARNLINKLPKNIKKKTIHIDGDNFRRIFNDLGHTLKDRKINAERVSKLVNFININLNVVIVVSLLSISQKWLNWNKINNKKYYQIFLDVPVHILKKRNVRKIYSNKNNVVGIHINYKKPINNYMTFKNIFNKKFLIQATKKILTNKNIRNSLKKI
tara:strand:- start:132 stop:647 length:516 start_codon:yes stop_codon:yes gene_type:complete